MMLASDEFEITMAALMVAMGVALVWIIAYQWRRVRVAAYDARLKQLMIERGMSVGEIERVLRAGDRSNAVRRFQAGCCTGDVHPERDGV